jgi:hypothetical protein
LISGSRFDFPSSTQDMGTHDIRKNSDTMSILVVQLGWVLMSKVDVALEIYDAVSNALKMSGLSDETAKKYSYFAVELYNYIKDRPQLQTALQGIKSAYETAKGAQGYVDAAHLAANATTMNALGSAERFVARGNVSAGGAISAFVDYFAGLAKSMHIEMNECALAVTKVMLDVLTAVALLESVVGVWAAALQVLATGADSKDMIKACFSAA